MRGIRELRGLRGLRGGREEISDERGIGRIMGRLRGLRGLRGMRGLRGAKLSQHGIKMGLNGCTWSQDVPKSSPDGTGNRKYIGFP